MLTRDYTEQEAADALRISVYSLARLRKRGLIRFMRLTRKPTYTAEMIEEFRLRMTRGGEKRTRK